MSGGLVCLQVYWKYFRILSEDHFQVWLHWRIMSCESFDLNLWPYIKKNWHLYMNKMFWYILGSFMNVFWRPHKVCLHAWCCRLDWDSKYIGGTIMAYRGRQITIFSHVMHASFIVLSYACGAFTLEKSAVVWYHSLLKGSVTLDYMALTSFVCPEGPPTWFDYNVQLCMATVK
jgi:hypothetical protein